MSKRVIKRFLSLLLIVIFVFSTNNRVFAASEEKTLSDDGKHVVCINGGNCHSNGTMTIYFDLDSYVGLTQKITVNARSNSQTGMLILHLYSPNDSLRSNDWLMGVNEVGAWDIFLPASGTWRLEVAAQGTTDQVHVHASW